MTAEIVFARAILEPGQHKALVAHMGPTAEMYVAELPDGRLNVLRWKDGQGWHLNIAHVLATLNPTGEPRAGRNVHLAEIRAAQMQLLGPEVALGLVFPPPAIPAAAAPGQVVPLGEISFAAATTPQRARNSPIIQ